MVKVGIRTWVWKSPYFNIGHMTLKNSSLRLSRRYLLNSSSPYLSYWINLQGLYTCSIFFFLLPVTVQIKIVMTASITCIPFPLWRSPPIHLSDWYFLLLTVFQSFLYIHSFLKSSPYTKYWIIIHSFFRNILISWADIQNFLQTNCISQSLTFPCQFPLHELSLVSRIYHFSRGKMSGPDMDLS